MMMMRMMMVFISNTYSSTLLFCPVISVRSYDQTFLFRSWSGEISKLESGVDRAIDPLYKSNLGQIIANANIFRPHLVWQKICASFVCVPIFWSRFGFEKDENSSIEFQTVIWSKSSQFTCKSNQIWIDLGRISFFSSFFCWSITPCRLLIQFSSLRIFEVTKKFFSFTCMTWMLKCEINLI